MSNKPKIKGPVRKRIIKPGESEPEVEIVAMPLIVAEAQRDLIFRMARLLGFREIKITESSLGTIDDINEYLDKLGGGDDDNGSGDEST